MWNFAYGANLNPISLTKRRKIRPTCSVGGVLPGWELVFNCQGFPAFEPAFANVQKSDVPHAQVHGVLHQYVRVHLTHSAPHPLTCCCVSMQNDSKGG